MNQYSITEELNLVERLPVTKEVKKLLKEQKAKLKKQGIKMSMSKIACNAIIKHCSDQYE